eukprot:8539348-Pyramimonas_sp.AAC.1
MLSQTPKPTAAAVGQAASCLEWAQAAAAWTASPVQNEQDPLSGIIPSLSIPISCVQIGVGGCFPVPQSEPGGFAAENAIFQYMQPLHGWRAGRFHSVALA